MYNPKISYTPILDQNAILSQCQGDLSSKILIISDVSEDNKENAQLQINIFKSIDYNYPQDFLVLNITKTTYFKLIDLLESTQIDFVMTFGVPLSHFGLQHELEDFEHLKIRDVTLIKSTSFKALQENKSHKAALWGTLKTVFK